MNRVFSKFERKQILSALESELSLRAASEMDGRKRLRPAPAQRGLRNGRFGSAESASSTTSISKTGRSKSKHSVGAGNHEIEITRANEPLMAVLEATNQGRDERLLTKDPAGKRLR